MGDPGSRATGDLASGCLASGSTTCRQVSAGLSSGQLRARTWANISEADKAKKAPSLCVHPELGCGCGNAPSGRCHAREGSKLAGCFYRPAQVVELATTTITTTDRDSDPSQSFSLNCPPNQNEGGQHRTCERTSEKKSCYYLLAFWSPLFGSLLHFEPFLLAAGGSKRNRSWKVGKGREVPTEVPWQYCLGSNA